MKLTIYGNGCNKSQRLASNASEAANSLEISYELEEVSDMKSIISAGIQRTPALLVDDKVVAEGEIPSSDEIRSLLINS
jgi:small redox-active disulfide protein 2